MGSETVCFVAGASRGLGLALVNELATRYPDAVVYAGVRDPANSPALHTLASRLPESKVHITKWVAADKQVNGAVAELIREKHGHVDIVIANAAISKSSYAPVSEMPIEDFKEMLEVNTTGVLVLFQSLYPLLKASTHLTGAKFVPISSGAGSIDGSFISGKVLAGYGASKAAMNYLCRKMHFENEWLVCFPINPGAVVTDMFEEFKAADTVGELSKNLDRISKTPEDTARLLVDVVNDAKREPQGGEFLNYNGGKNPW
ncbi:hypothetical protein D9619_004959 [Psilocybe cf. subviscida]|uniref:Uncharacterized protein n=1 Tax=Psilocybe cf. subviscida TaxID=2480587 RepID=A0A8H5BRS3_9AGAR|nr:hypothetical protein D9619_004959 [Psilocybe cf. subviscida]